MFSTVDIDKISWYLPSVAKKLGPLGTLLSITVLIISQNFFLIFLKYLLADQHLTLFQSLVEYSSTFDVNSLT